MGAEGCGIGAGAGELVAPGVVGVADYQGSAAVQNTGHIALYIGNIVVGRIAVSHRHGHAAGIIGKIQGAAANLHLAELRTVIHIVAGGSAVCFLGSQAVGIVGIAPSGGAVGHRCQLAAMLPGVSPSAVGQGIAYGVIGNGMTVVGSQQIAPTLSIAVGIRNGVCWRSQSTGSIGILLAFLNVTGLIVSPGISIVSCLVVLPDQLVRTVVDIAGSVRAIVDSQDITVLIVGIAKGLGQSGRCYIMGSDLGRGCGTGRIVKGEGIRLDRGGMCFVWWESRCCDSHRGAYLRPKEGNQRAHLIKVRQTYKLFIFIILSRYISGTI